MEPGRVCGQPWEVVWGIIITRLGRGIYLAFSESVSWFLGFFSTRATCCYGNKDGTGSPELLTGLTEACE